MKKPIIRYLVLSDIHLGHNINKTELITSNLRKYIFKNKKFKNLDIIFIAGDIFDRLLQPSSSEMLEATGWLTELIIFCKKNSIKLRILEGTPSHDWKQAKLISNIILELKIDIDYKYIETLNIEVIEELGLSILYIPDEYRPKAIDTYKDVKKLLKSYNIEKVDIAIMHGQFHYQLPFQLESSHNESDYLEIVRYYIHIGHIHTFSARDRIIAQGSFDRLTHGEEEEKGGVMVTMEHLYDNIDYKYEFIPNIDAMIFKTIETNDDLDNVIRLIKGIYRGLKLPASIRIITDNNMGKNISTLKTLFPGLYLKIESRKKVDEKKIGLITEEIVDESFTISKENIEDLLLNEIKKYNFSKEDMILFKQIMREVI